MIHIPIYILSSYQTSITVKAIYELKSFQHFCKSFLKRKLNIFKGFSFLWWCDCKKKSPICWS